MDFTVTTHTTADFTLDDALCVMLQHPLCDQIIKQTYFDHPKRIVPGLSFGAAMTIFRTQVRKQATGSGHPTAVLSAHATEHPITITPNVIQVAKTAPVNLVYQRGYFVDETNQNTSRLVACKAHVADMLAYTFTPSKAIDATNVCESNFSKGNVAVGIPHIDGSRRMSPDFKARDGAGNGFKIFAQVKGPNEWLGALQATMPLTDSLVQQKFEAQADTVILKQTVKAPRVYTPPVKLCPSADFAYRALNLHRGVRGEDKKWLSPLTSGYYLGSMPRAIEDIWWRVADIVHVAKSIGAKILVLGASFGLYTARSVAVNGYIVFYMASSSADDPTEEEKKLQQTRLDEGIGTHIPYSNLDMVKVLAHAHLYVDVGIKASHSFASKTIVETPEWKRHMQSLVSRSYPWMTWWGVTDIVLKEAAANKIGVEFSVHAHSGHALFVRSIKQPVHWLDDAAYLGPRHYGRMVTANVYKTHFPYSRRRFYEVDIRKYNFKSLSIPKLILALNITRKPKVELTLTDDVEGMVHDDEDQLPDFSDLPLDRPILPADQAYPMTTPAYVPDKKYKADDTFMEFVAALSTTTTSSTNDVAGNGGGNVDDDSFALETDAEDMGGNY